MKSCVYRVALASSVFLACDDPLSYEELLGGYTLVEVNATPLPSLIGADVNCDSWIDTGDLILDNGGQFSLLLRGHLDCSRSGGPVQDIGWDFPGTYTVDGSKLHFISPTYPSGTYEFNGFVGPLQLRIRVEDLEMPPSLSTVDLEFRH